MKPVRSVGRLLGVTIATLLVGLVSPGAVGASDSRAKVVSVELHRSANEERTALLLQVRNFRSGHGRAVDVSHRDFVDNQVFARRVKGSYRRWRVGPRTKDGRELLDDLQDALERKGAARVDAGVLASAPSGGKLSHFRIKEFNEPAPALGALPH